MLKGFEPVFDSKSRILILGSFPSVKSREQGFYYGNPQNRFWKMLEKAFCSTVGNSKIEKIEFLLKNRLALWDIVDSCDIAGSSDSSIKNAAAVDLFFILSACEIQKIICNGKKAFEVLSKSYPEILIKYNCVCLPSTSPANVSYNENNWIDELNS